MGAILVKTPADQICSHAKCGPTEPCWRSHVSLGRGIWLFWGALRAISSVGDRFCRLGTQPTKLSFGRNSEPPASFGNVVAHRNRVWVAQLSYSDNVGGFQPSFSRKSRLTGFWRGLGTERNSGPQPTKKNLDPEKIEKCVEFFVFVGVSKKHAFVKNRSDFFSFSALGAPHRGRAH